MPVKRLSYVALEVADMPAWQDLLTSVFGFQLLPRDGGETLDVRLDGYHHRLTLYPAETPAVAAVGWEVDSSDELDELAERLRGQGIELNAGSSALCAERHMQRLYRFTEPNIGVATEISYGPTQTDARFEPSREISGYNTGPDVGLGHIVFWTADLQRTVDFYVEVMGFKLSDTIAWDDNDAVFLHCNRRHHTLAVMAEAPGRPAGALGHMMFEAQSFDDVGSGYDIVRDKGFPIALEPGKHTNDHMQSFYLQSPAGWWIEYGFGGRHIDEDWKVGHYDAPMLWGHRMASQ